MVIFHPRAPAQTDSSAGVCIAGNTGATLPTDAAVRVFAWEGHALS